MDWADFLGPTTFLLFTDDWVEGIRKGSAFMGDMAGFVLGTSWMVRLVQSGGVHVTRDVVRSEAMA